MKLRLTDWFPGNVPPVHVGWYPVKACYEDFAANFTQHPVRFSIRYWNGERWLWRDESGRLRKAAVAAEDSWRGLSMELK